MIERCAGVFVKGDMKLRKPVCHPFNFEKEN
jgi:hypothetical protein